MIHRRVPAILISGLPAARRCLLALRMLLVLLLVFDQISSPLHTHHHDGVPGGQAQLFSAAHEFLAQHAESADELGSGHSIAAVKSEARAMVVAAKPAAGVAPGMHWLVAPALQICSLQADWPPERARPHSTHRNLPPGSQGPPSLA